ncbi:MAG: type IX secretion system membrane protein PorP/SprF [Tannerella sp.]|jgi:type IX secretion system PorP/SprF family membrane protein|nr:type IX secretion system membrane protein PorP/SprF [Tannerella sp.]
MDRKRFWLIIVTGSLCAVRAWAQSDAQFNQYFTAMGYYNPAYAGKTGELNVSALYNMQWLGMGGNTPKTMLVAADMPWKYGKSLHGLGVVVYNETLGLDKNMYTSAQYAFKKKIGKGTLSIGLQAGLLSAAFDGASIYIPDSEDHESADSDEAMPTAQVDAMGLDLAAGLFYYTNKYYVGVGSTHLLEPKLDLDENTERIIPRMYNLTAGYNIQMNNPLLELQPSVFAQTNLQMVSADVTLRGVYNNMYNGGLGGRISDGGKMTAAIVYFGMTIKGFRIGYAYEFPTSALIRASAGSHELTASYRLKLDKPKGNRNRHKSVRIL